jgi:hypothetical protein
VLAVARDLATGGGAKLLDGVDEIRQAFLYHEREFRCRTRHASEARITRRQTGAEGCIRNQTRRMSWRGSGVPGEGRASRSGANFRGGVMHHSGGRRCSADRSREDQSKGTEFPAPRPTRASRAPSAPLREGHGPGRLSGGGVARLAVLGAPSGAMVSPDWHLAYSVGPPAGRVDGPASPELDLRNR